MTGFLDEGLDQRLPEDYVDALRARGVRTARELFGWFPGRRMTPEELPPWRQWEQAQWAAGIGFVVDVVRSWTSGAVSSALVVELDDGTHVSVGVDGDPAPEWSGRPAAWVYFEGIVLLSDEMPPHLVSFGLERIGAAPVVPRPWYDLPPSLSSSYLRWQLVELLSGFADDPGAIGPGGLRDRIRLAHDDPAACSDADRRQTALTLHGWVSPLGPEPMLPDPRLVKTSRDAELYAAEVMSALGYTDPVVCRPGADGGVDVRCREAVVQVKMEGIATGAPVVRSIYGVARLEGRVAALFSLSGYTSQARSFAEAGAIALFEFDYAGGIAAISSRARQLLAAGR